MRFTRSSGVFLHPTSLPGKYGIGTLGSQAYEFVDFLAAAEQSLWQVCPLGPTGYGNSPYQSFSAFAGNPYLINLEQLREEGLLTQEDLAEAPDFPSDKVNYGEMINFKVPILKKAFREFKASASNQEQEEFASFCRENEDWLVDYGLFRAIKEHFGGRPWTEWEEKIKFRDSETLEEYKAELADKIEFREFLQYIFFKQWTSLKDYANQREIKIIGDIPIFVAFDSADAWAHPDLFFFDEDLSPTKVAGVPPDYFSETGQLWGNPLYKWERLQENDYQWWIERIKATLRMVDIIRIDHFRGFQDYWAVPAGAESALHGEWKPGPREDFFQTVEKKLGKLPFLAEDLGIIPEEVEELRNKFSFPGMKILQFAFHGGGAAKYLPHNYPKNCVAYTGTHDNNTTLGWYEDEATDEEKRQLHHYLEKNLDYKHGNICWDFIELISASPAVFAITPLQDILSLGNEARLNTPGAPDGNWQWRFKREDLTSELTDRLLGVTKRNNRD